MSVLSTIDVIGGIREAWSTMLVQMREKVFEPTGRKTLDMKFSIEHSAALLGRTPNGLRKAVSGRPDLAPKVKANGRPYYTVHDLQRIRNELDWHPGKKPGERAARIAIQNFKGGVGKSTLSVHLSHYFGLRGYRVLVIDCDSQASTTSLFDLQPDLDLADDETIAHYMRPRGGTNSLDSVVRDTVWPTIKIAPANLSLQHVEYELVSEMKNPAGFARSITRLKSGIDAISDDFDVVILDPPPALGFMALNAMIAANSLIIPAPAKQMDFSSATSFMSMLEANLASIRDLVEVEYEFLHILCSNYETNRSADAAIWNVMQHCSGTRLLPTPLAHSEQIKHAANLGRSAYELEGPTGSSTTYRNCLHNLDAVFGEIEIGVRKMWPSHARELARELSKRGMVVEVAA